MSHPPILVDSAFPIVVSAHPTSAGPTAVAHVLAAYEANFARERRFAFITRSLPGGTRLTAHDRLKIAEWANTPRVRELTRRWVVCSAAIVAGRLERGTMTALLWLWTPPSPHSTCATSEEAVGFCLARLEAAGLVRDDQRARLQARAMSLLGVTEGLRADP